MLRDRRRIKQDDHELIQNIFNLGSFKRQLKITDGDPLEEETKKLMSDFLPLVVGDSPLEAFCLPPGKNQSDCGDLGLGVGIRVSPKAPPLTRSTVPSIYGDLMEIHPEIEEELEDWKKFSTIALNGATTSPTYMMLGPIQLVSFLKIKYLFF